jgi:hypothetical protein
MAPAKDTATVWPTFVSAAYDAGSSTSFYSIFWEADTPSGTSVKFQVAANNDNATWSFVGPDGTSGTWFTTSGGSLPSSCQGKRYIKYKAVLSTTDPTVTPSLRYVHIPVNGTTPYATSPEDYRALLPQYIDRALMTADIPESAILHPAN